LPDVWPTTTYGTLNCIGQTQRSERDGQGFKKAEKQGNDPPGNPCFFSESLLCWKRLLMITGQNERPLTKAKLHRGEICFWAFIIFINFNILMINKIS
jgi:hypothetical protein